MRAIDCRGETVVVGTRGGQIIRLKSDGSQKSVVLNSHYAREVWAIDVHPTKPEFLSLGEDCLLAKWQSGARECQLAGQVLQTPGTAIGIGSNG